jgi:hypothetical protein
MNMKVTFGHNEGDVSEYFRFYTKRYGVVCMDVQVACFIEQVRH